MTMSSTNKASSSCKHCVFGLVNVLALMVFTIGLLFVSPSLQSSSSGQITATQGLLGDDEILFTDGFEAITAIVSTPIVAAATGNPYTY